MITFITGPNAFARRLSLQKLQGDFVESHGSGGIERYDGEDVQPAQLTELLRGATLFSTAKLVILRGASANKPLWEALDDQLDTIPDDTHLALIDPEPDRRTRTYKHLQKVAQVIACDNLDERALINWLVAQSDQRLTPALAQLLVQRVGNDQMMLASEFDKLLVQPGTITKELIQDITSTNAEGNAFGVLDALLSGDSASVEGTLQLLRASEDPYRLFGLITSQTYTLVQVWGRQTEAPDAMAKAIGAHPFVVRKMRAYGQRLTKNDIRDLVKATAELDMRLKNSALDPWDLLVQALLGMTQSKKRR